MWFHNFFKKTIPIFFLQPFTSGQHQPSALFKGSPSKNTSKKASFRQSFAEVFVDLSQFLGVKRRAGWNGGQGQPSLTVSTKSTGFYNCYFTPIFGDLSFCPQNLGLRRVVVSSFNRICYSLLEVQQRAGEAPWKCTGKPQKEAGSSSGPIIFQGRTVKLWGCTWRFFLFLLLVVNWLRFFAGRCLFLCFSRLVYFLKEHFHQKDWGRWVFQMCWTCRVFFLVQPPRSCLGLEVIRKQTNS